MASNPPARRRRVLVSGGAGYIGSHTCLELVLRGLDVVVLDSLANSKEESLRRVRRLAAKAEATGSVNFSHLDLLDAAALGAAVRAHGPFDACIHFAALKAVGESVARPLEYYRTNIGALVGILQACADAGIEDFVFSSSATVYGARAEPPMHERLPVVFDDILNPYGATKAMAERILHDFSRSRPTFRIACLRYFNPVGAHPSGLMGEDPNSTPNNLVPFIERVAAGRLPRLTVHGGDYATPDGTAERDYLHVVDLALGHVAAIDWLARLAPGAGTFEAINLGTGRPASVLQMLAAYERACGRKLDFVIGPRREGDAARVWADASKARELLGWTASRTLEDMCADSWRWCSTNPRGYESAALAAPAPPVAPAALVAPAAP
jgi:UDP-glucose 4-epimerase